MELLYNTLQSTEISELDKASVHAFSETIEVLWKVISSLTNLAASVKIERARLCHVKGTQVRVYNSSIAQHLDAGDDDIDRALLSPFGH